MKYTVIKILTHKSLCAPIYSLGFYELSKSMTGLTYAALYGLKCTNDVHGAGVGEHIQTSTHPNTSKQQAQPKTGTTKMLAALEKMSKLPSGKAVSVYIQSEIYYICINTHN